MVVFDSDSSDGGYSDGFGDDVFDKHDREQIDREKPIEKRKQSLSHVVKVHEAMGASTASEEPTDGIAKKRQSLSQLRVNEAAGSTVPTEGEVDREEPSTIVKRKSSLSARETIKSDREVFTTIPDDGIGSTMAVPSPPIMKSGAEVVTSVSSPDSSTLVPTPKKNAFFDKDDTSPITGRDFAKLSTSAWEASKTIDEITSIQDGTISKVVSPKLPEDPPELHQNLFNTTATTTKSRTSGRRQPAADKQLKVAFQSSSPELDIETGFAARVYAELLDVKKQVQQLQQERHQLRTCRRKAQRELQHEKKKHDVLLQSNGSLFVQGRKKVRSAAHLGPFAEEDVKNKTFRPTGINFSPTKSGLISEVSIPLPPQSRERIHSVTGRIVSESARVLAYKRRLASMHRELKILTAATVEAKSKPAYKKFERLTQLMEQLRQQADQLRGVLKKKTKMDSAKATAAAVQRSKLKLAKKDTELEELKEIYRESLERVRNLQLEVTVASQKVEAQTDTSEKLASRVNEARSALKAKREGLPEEKKRLSERLKSIEEHITLQTEKLTAIKISGERELEEQRESLKKCCNLSNHLKSEYEERERALERDRDVVQKMKDALRLDRSSWNEEEALLEEKCREAESAKGIDGAWLVEKEQLLQRIASLRSELAQIESDKSKTTTEHHKKLLDLQTTGEARERALLQSSQ
eukprot:TRINITY_DN20647_c0_g1_i1.p1 TRINITY_DN20647_c0_g1~~TRINITY_DN20647_c0_g1_i1.p1  ORF type:complete len:695 (+),score=156.89 TRINITY_DN20647_c0_g1_i1:68-2152(+)